MVRGVKMAGIGGGFWISSDLKNLLAELLWWLAFLILNPVHKHFFDKIVLLMLSLGWVMLGKGYKNPAGQKELRRLEISELNHKIRGEAGISGQKWE